MADITQQAQAYEEKKQLEAQEAALNQPADIGHDKLLAALYLLWDGFDRANMLFFACGTTGKQMHEDRNLAGDHLDIGVRKLEWTSGNKSIFDDFAASNYRLIKDDGEVAEYKVQDVPVKIHIFEDNPYITQCDSRVYFNETFNLPNPYDLFEKEYDR